MYLGTIFLLPRREVFTRPGPAAPSQPTQTQYLQRQRKPPTRIADLVRFSPEARVRGEPCGGCLHPWYPVGSSMATVRCTPAQFYTVYSPCI
jgi:hypothetical protein